MDGNTLGHKPIRPVRRRFEQTRLAAQYLAAAYQVLLPIHARGQTATANPVGLALQPRPRLLAGGVQT